MVCRALCWAVLIVFPALPTLPKQSQGNSLPAACSACFLPAFDGARSYATGSRGGGSIAIADFNGDGFLDLAYADSPDAYYVVMLGGPLGTFVSSKTYSLPSSSRAIAAADVDGDGNVDLITDAPQGFRILRGRGDGTFEPPRLVSIGYQPIALAIGDFNGDGHPDVVLQPYRGPTTAVLNFFFGDGHGGFAAAGQDVPAPYYLTTGLYVADFDGDGRDDVLAWTSNTDTFSITFGSPNLPLPEPISFPVGRVLGVAAADFNEDGRLDLAISDDQNRLSIYYNAGHRVFNSPVYRDAPVGSLAVGDFNGDGHADLAIAGREGPINLLGRSVLEILTGGGDGTFVAADYDGWAGQMQVVDLNRDGVSDIVFNPGFSIDVVLSGPRGLRLTPTLPTFYQTFQLLKGDFNGDGHEDLLAAAVVGLSTFSVQVFFGDGLGQFTPGPVFSLGSLGGSPIASGRFGGDAKTDLVVTTATGLRFLHSVGDGTFTQGADVVPSVSILNFVVGDLNGDGLDDLVLVRPDNKLEIRLTLESGGSGPPSYQDTGSYPRVPVLADFDGDGKLDVLVGNALSKDVSVLLGDGRGGFRSNSRYAVGGDPVFLSVADFNGDGRPDVGIHFFFGGRFEVHPGDGTGAIGPMAFSLASPDLAQVAIADVNGDGFPDVVAIGPLTVYPNRNGSSFDSGVGFWGGENRDLQFVIGDFNEDGKPDIASNSYYEDAIVVLLNGRCVPAALTLRNEPLSCSVADSPLIPPLSVAVVDAGGNPTRCATGSVAVSLVPGSGSPGARLDGATTVPIVEGQAEFSAIAVDRPGIEYQLQFAFPGLASVRSALFSSAADAFACRAFVHRQKSPRKVGPRPGNPGGSAR